MFRRFVSRAVLAPVVIAITTAAVPPANLESQVSKWLGHTLPATASSVDVTSFRDIFDRQLLETSADIAQLRAGLKSQALYTAVYAVRAHEEIATRFSAASGHISAKSEGALARIDSWMTSMSLTVIAALPGGPAEAAPVVVRDIPPAAVETATIQPVNIRVAALPPSPLPEIEETTGVRQPDVSAAETITVLPEPVAPLRRTQLAQREIKDIAPAPAVEKPAVLAALAVAPIAAAAPAAPALPPADVKIAGEEKEKPAEKQVLASLGSPATAAAVDTQPAPAGLPATVEASLAPEPETDTEEFEDRHIDNGGADMPPSVEAYRGISAPLKLRALTRADIPSAEKFASLGSAVKSDARHMPAEQQRVAYDEPVMTELPVSVGKRKWIDETKYSGLGKPEALLEALRHLGANAKSLGLPPSLWCADFMNLVLRKTGIKATGSRAARSYLEYGQKIDEPRVGAIAVLSRGKNNGHIGIVRGTDGNGNPIIISGNHNKKVAEAVYPKHRVLAYVVPK